MKCAIFLTFFFKNHGHKKVNVTLTAKQQKKFSKSDEKLLKKYTLGNGWMFAYLDREAVSAKLHEQKI